MNTFHKNFINLVFIFSFLSLAGCASDDSFSSHFSLKDRIQKKNTIDVFFVDFQPARISVLEKCESSLKNCVISRIIEKPVLSALGISDIVSEQKSRISLNIRNAFDSLLLMDLFFITLKNEVNKCGIQLNRRQAIAVKNDDLGSISGMTSLRWIIGGGDATQHTRNAIFPKIPHTDDKNSIILLVAFADTSLYLGTKNTLSPTLAYQFYDKEIDSITSLMGNTFAAENKEMRILRDIGSQSEIENELKKSVVWSSKRLAYDICGGISSDNQYVKLLGNELRQ